MATVEQKVCDVTGSNHKDVETYQVVVSVVLPKHPDVGIDHVDKTLDLCPAALKRLLKFVERGTTPIQRKKD